MGKRRKTEERRNNDNLFSFQKLAGKKCKILQSRKNIKFGVIIKTDLLKIS